METLDSMLGQHAHSEDLLTVLVRVNVLVFCFVLITLSLFLLLFVVLKEMKAITRAAISQSRQAYICKRNDVTEHSLKNTAFNLSGKSTPQKKIALKKMSVCLKIALKNVSPTLST